MANKYFGFSDREDIAREFQEGTGNKYGGDPPFVVAVDFPTEEQILFATYDSGGYDGFAFVVLEIDGKLFEVNASHCSCYGLEDAWSLEETTKEALGIRIPYEIQPDALKVFRELFPAPEEKA